jgi:hypothetical protein
MSRKKKDSPPPPNERETLPELGVSDDGAEPTPPTLTLPKAPGFVRSLGYKADEEDPRDFHAGMLLGARRKALPLEMSLEEHIPGIFDQGATSSCVGHGIFGAVETRLAKMGMKRTAGQRASRMGIYTLARALGRASASETLQDEGSFPRRAMKAVKDLGVPTEQSWPFDPTLIFRGTFFKRRVRSSFRRSIALRESEKSGWGT